MTNSAIINDSSVNHHDALLQALTCTLNGSISRFSGFAFAVNTDKHTDDNKGSHHHHHLLHQQRCS